MTAGVAALNLALGLIYAQYGTMTLYEMFHNRRTLGFSHFGFAWVAMAFTCGPHHWVHGIHVALEGRAGGPIDLLAVLVGLPAGLTWFLLRVEAFRGGAGDRFVRGRPLWVLALPTLAGIYVTVLVAAGLASGGVSLENLPVALPSLLLTGAYLAIGWYLIRTQLANHRPLGGWSLSGLALATIFPTCAAMHAVFGFYSLTGRYAFDIHGAVIDIVAVPAGLYFLWVVRALYTGKFADWNGSPVRARTGRSSAPEVAPAG